MSTSTTVQPDAPFDAQGLAPAPAPATRPLYWSVRRELWEHRSIYVAPLAVTALALFGTAISMLALARQSLALPQLVVKLLGTAPAPIMFVAFLVGVFYSLDALYGERRNRSILFWKSLPVSDLITVLAKASIPLVVLPAIAFALSLATFLVLLLLGTAILSAQGASPAPLWAGMRLFQQPLVMAYGLGVHVLWFAPIYGWLLFVSAWARRAPALWAALPWFAALAVEKVAFDTSYVSSLLRYRFAGAMEEAFAITPQRGGVGIIDQLSQLDPVRFVISPGLWIGLILAAAFLAAAVRLRRYREPI